jgi:hypothetical protein
MALLQAYPNRAIPWFSAGTPKGGEISGLSCDRKENKLGVGMHVSTQEAEAGGS